mmetsp:Transcript_41871/g.107903  ORF Transcript_41871/g.107903 Transcript_41871/m.107903 type:complete len:470 (-) Transcript_41871:106-1515(-)
MIYYRQDTWRDQIFRFSGTIWPNIWREQVLITIYTIASYVFCAKMGGNLGKVKGNFLGGILSFLLVFRTSQSYSRYWQGRSLLTGFFCDLREILILSMNLMPGGARGHQWRWKTSRKVTSTAEKSREMVQSLESFTDDDDRIMSEERVDILRWAFVVAIAFQAHARMVYSLEHGDLPAEIQKLVDWDRFRIRCLTTKAEFRDLDRLVSGTAIPQAAWEDSLLLDPKGFLKEMEEDFFQDHGDDSIEVSAEPGLRLPVVAIFQLTQVLHRNVNDQRLQDKRYGMAERFFSGMASRMLQLNKILNTVVQIVATPLPFPYFHLCKSLLFVYFLSFPFFIDISLGIWANCGELCFLTTALLGLDSIATELENPFGCDSNDLSIADDIQKLEKETLFYSRMIGDIRLEDSFLWIPVPHHIAQICPGVTGYFVLKTQWESNGSSPEVYPFKRIERETLTDAEFVHEDREHMSDDS